MPSHYLNQGWNIVNWILGPKIHWNLNRNLYIFIQENAFEIVIRKVAAILSRLQCVITRTLLIPPIVPISVVSISVVSIAVVCISVVSIAAVVTEKRQAVNPLNLCQMYILLLSKQKPIVIGVSQLWGISRINFPVILDSPSQLMFLKGLWRHVFSKMHLTYSFSSSNVLHR